MATLCSPDKPSLPSFIRKIFQILSTPEYSHIICWDKDGKSIKIFDFKDLEEEVLEVEFRHRNHRSFIRQLNMYGFKKMRKSTSTTIYFFHPLFTRDGEDSLHLIERKRENKRRLKLDLLCESVGDESKDEEFRKMKKRRAVLKFLGMEKPGEGSDAFDRDSNSNSSSAVVPVEQVLLNPTNAIKQRKTSIKIAPIDPTKNNCKVEELSKRSLDLQTNSTLRKQDICSTTFDARSFKSELSNTPTKPRNQFENRGFSTYQIPSTTQSSPFTPSSEQMFSPMQMFPYSPFASCIYQSPQFPMYTQPIYFTPSSQFQCFALPQ